MVCAVIAVVVPVLAWQAVFSPLTHTDNFNGSVDDGQMDGQVEYASGERRARCEGAYLSWSSQDIAAMQGYVGMNPAMYVAASHHAFNKNTAACNALRSQSGWNWSNLPQVSAEMLDGGCEVRHYINNPWQMVAGADYYSQVLYKDTAYPGTKTQGETTYSTYLIQVSAIRLPVERDYNGKICINPDAAYAPSGGSCY